MKTLTISEARSHLTDLVRDMKIDREPIVLTRHGKPVARIEPLRRDRKVADRYTLRGLPIEVSSDFDDPCEDLWSVLR